MYLKIKKKKTNNYYANDYYFGRDFVVDEYDDVVLPDARDGSLKIPNQT